MISQETKKKIQVLQIKTKRRLNSLMIANASSVSKGSGYDFDQIREYSPGDDIRLIDFKSFARMNKLFVMQYLEERNRTILILVDVSASTFYSSQEKLKHETISEIASIIAIAANHSNDKVGVCFFTDKIIKFISPNKGNSHINRLMEELYSFENENGKTNIDLVLKEYITKAKRNHIVFLVSDFIDENIILKNLNILSNFNDLIAVKYNDKMEANLNQIGLVNLQDLESGQEYCMDLSNKNKTKIVESEIHNHFNSQVKAFKKYKVDCLVLNNNQDHILEIIKFFNKRLMY